MIWTVLKWIGIVLGGVLVLLVALLGVALIRGYIQDYRKRRCPDCGGRKFQHLTYAHARMREGADIWITFELCLRCQKVWRDHSRESRLLPCTEELAQRARDDYARLEKSRKMKIHVRRGAR
jgi:hypothetical protein